MVYSPELPRKPLGTAGYEEPAAAVSRAGSTEKPESGGAGADMVVPLNKKAGRRDTPGSISFVPSAAGLLAAGEVIRYLAELN